mmetsp:Transcript_8952/g.18063  ORF Transcript_8952/g.18063 Transcript_8952/m.18063 type:complete len:175 (+) Transcript_8952:120-644(+)
MGAGCWTMALGCSTLPYPPCLQMCLPLDQRALPPYCCIILAGEGGELLMEERQQAKVAAGKLTCFGGKREAAERPLSCVLRECLEELGWTPATVPHRVVDLYVDGELIAWFYEAAAPSRDEPLTFEPGRRGVWLSADEVLEHPQLSDWHASVLRARSLGERRADFITTPAAGVA